MLNNSCSVVCVAVEKGQNVDEKTDGAWKWQVWMCQAREGKDTQYEKLTIHEVSKWINSYYTRDKDRRCRIHGQRMNLYYEQTGETFQSYVDGKISLDAAMLGSESYSLTPDQGLKIRSRTDGHSASAFNTYRICTYGIKEYKFFREAKNKLLELQQRYEGTMIDVMRCGEFILKFERDDENIDYHHSCDKPQTIDAQSQPQKIDSH